MGSNQTNYYMTLKKNISSLRMEAGLTQEQLAEKTNISKSYLSKIEAPNCSKTPSIDVLICISKSLDVPIKSFFDKN